MSWTISGGSRGAQPTWADRLNNLISGGRFGGAPQENIITIRRSSFLPEQMGSQTAHDDSLASVRRCLSNCSMLLNSTIAGEKQQAAEERD